MTEVLDEIGELASDLPLETLQRFAAGKPVPGAAGERLAELWGKCKQSHPPVTREALALALLATGKAVDRERKSERVDLIWTGPGGAELGLRRIEPALLELIANAQKHLLIVTFAAYEVHDIRGAVADAAARGVQVRLVTEHAQEGGKVKLSPMKALIEQNIVASIRVFHWPHAMRPTIDGKFGTLHAKSAVADDHTMLISSANFTGHALAINMELGVRVNGGPLPRRVREHFDELIRKGELQEIQN